MPQTSNQGVSIRYELAGSGFPLLLYPGLLVAGDSWREAGYVDPLVTMGFQCILLDQRGHGHSDKPRDVANHRMECYVGDALAVLDDCGIRRAAFWGFSDGARVGLACAARHPDRLVALIASGRIYPTDSAEAEDRRESAHSLRETGEAALLLSPEEFEQEEGIPLPGWVQPAILATDPEMCALEEEGWIDWAPWQLLPTITTPSLILVGEREDPDRTMERAASIMPDARCVVLPALGHNGAWLQSGMALPHATAFLKEIVGTQ